MNVVLSYQVKKRHCTALLNNICKLKVKIKILISGLAMHIYEQLGVRFIYF